MFGISKKKGHGGKHKHGKIYGHCYGDRHRQERGGHPHGHRFEHGVAAGHRADKIMELRAFGASKRAGQEHFSTNGGTCPLCKEHCPASEPGCNKGAAYFDSLNAA